MGGNYHKSVSVIILNKNKQLCVLWHRKMGKLHLPGGKFERGESCTSAAKRELKEELKIHLSETVYIAHIDLEKIEYPENSGIFVDIGHDIVYAKGLYGPIRNVESEKHAGILWLSMEELKRADGMRSCVLDKITNSEISESILSLPPSFKL